VIASAPGKGAGVCDKSAAGRSQTVDFKDGEMSEWLSASAAKPLRRDIALKLARICDASGSG